MFRTHTCGELRISDVNKQVTLSGWVQRSRKMGGMTFIDLRDRYGITQLVFNEEVNAELCERANKLGREFVIQVKGTVNERFSKNANIPPEELHAVEVIIDVLEKGKVNVITPNRETIVLTPGEQLLYDKQSQKSVKNKVDVYGKIAWKDGKLVFRNTPLEEIFKRLERHFNVDIQYNNRCEIDRKSTRLNSSHRSQSRMPSSA